MPVSAVAQPALSTNKVAALNAANKQRLYDMTYGEITAYVMFVKEHGQPSDERLHKMAQYICDNFMSLSLHTLEIAYNATE